MSTKIIPRTIEQEVQISDCGLGIVGQINEDMIFGQGTNTETYIDRCVVVDRLLTYNVRGEQVEVVGCESCSHFKGKEK